GRSAPQTLYNVVHASADLTPVPDALREIVRRCLEKEPGKRPKPAELVEEPVEAEWPAAVCDLIARQHAEAGELLTPAERTAHFRGPTRILDPAFTRAGEKPKQRRHAGPVLVAVLVVLVIIIVAAAPWHGTTRSGGGTGSAASSSAAETPS